MRLMRIAAILCIGVLISAQSPESDDLESAFDKDSLIISASQHACHLFEIYIATTRAQHVRGLMRVRDLPFNTGMLFVYKTPAVRSMWMKDTYIPLDILFIRADGTISSIETHTEPLSLRTISATEPLIFVLELNAGVTDQLVIDSDSVVHFSNSS